MSPQVLQVIVKFTKSYIWLSRSITDEAFKDDRSNPTWAKKRDLLGLSLKKCLKENWIPLLEKRIGEGSVKEYSRD